jgi:hypothetical protein
LQVVILFGYAVFVVAALGVAASSLRLNFGDGSGDGGSADGGNADGGNRDGGGKTRTLYEQVSWL